MFENSLPVILEHEQYYAFVPGDKGGETYAGIARKSNPNWAGWLLIDREKALHGGKLPRNHKVMQQGIDYLVAQLYRNKYWNPINLDHVNDQNLQTIIFDAYVNSGGNGIKVLQRVLNEKFGKNLKVDGAQGMQTVNAINSVNPQQLFNAYKDAREQYYRNIATGDNAKFLSGWLNRIRGFNYVAVGLSIGGIALLIGGFFLSGI